MEKILRLSLAILFITFSISSNDSWHDRAKKSILQTGECIYNNPGQSIGALAIGATTLYGTYLLRLDQYVLKSNTIFPSCNNYREVLGLLTATYWYKRFSHYYQFDAINKKISDATIYENELQWTVWKLNQWPTAERMIADSQSVCNELTSKIIDKKAKEAIKNQIQLDKEQLQKWICYIGAFSDFPEDFVKMIEKKGKRVEYTTSIFDTTSSAKKAIAAAHYLKDLQSLKLDEDNASKLVKQENHYCIYYYKKWYNPFTWTLAPWSTKARMLTAKLLRLYGRLLVLEDIVKKFKVHTPTIDKVKELSSTRVNIHGTLGQL